MTHFWSLGLALALTLDAGFAAAQQAPAPAAPPPPPQAAVAPAPVLPREATPTPPPRPAAAIPAANRTPVFAEPVRPPTPGSPPPDSVRPAVAPMDVTPPANAVARCRDGTFILPPNDASACATHRGVLVVLPQAAGARPPVAPASRALTPVAASRAAGRDAAPPAGATMRCKDGTYLTGAAAAGRCDANGGLVAVLPPAREASPPPLPRRP